MKRSIGRVDQSRGFLLTEHPGKATHLLRIGRLGNAPATLQHVNVEEPEQCQPQDDRVRAELKLGEQSCLILAYVLRAKLIGPAAECSTPCRYVRMVVAAKLRRCNSSSKLAKSRRAQRGIPTSLSGGIGVARLERRSRGTQRASTSLGLRRTSKRRYFVLPTASSESRAKAAANPHPLQLTPQAALRTAIRPRMNFRLRRISASTDAGLSVSSCAHPSNPTSASASITAWKSIFPSPR